MMPSCFQIPAVAVGAVTVGDATITVPDTPPHRILKMHV